MVFADDDWYGDTRRIDIALICLNGHVVNDRYIAAPYSNTDYCQKCGQATISKCQDCDAEIRGAYSNVFGGYKAPKYCHKCGKPYPWTATALQAAQELTDENEVLSTEEKEQLKSTFEDLVKESPRTTVAASRYKRLTAKAGGILGEALKAILVELVVQNARSLIWATQVK